VEGRLVVANAADEDLLAGLQGLDLPPLSGGEGLKGFEYLLRMRVDRLKAKAVAELEEELAAVRVVRDTLAAMTPEQLWLNDLELFSEAFARFKAVREAAMDASKVPVKVKAVKVAKAPKATKGKAAAATKA